VSAPEETQNFTSLGREIIKSDTTNLTDNITQGIFIQLFCRPKVFLIMSFQLRFDMARKMISGIKEVETIPDHVDARTAGISINQ
jgi:hypothetical protein